MCPRQLRVTDQLGSWFRARMWSWHLTKGLETLEKHENSSLVKVALNLTLFRTVGY